MKIGRHLEGILNPDAGREPSVQRIGKFFRRNPGFRVKYGDIAQCVHPRIGPARADDPDLLSGEL